LKHLKIQHNILPVLLAQMYKILFVAQMKDFFLAQMKYQLAQKQGVDFNTIIF
jgi:hypothetical protein